MLIPRIAAGSNDLGGVAGERAAQHFARLVPAFAARKIASDRLLQVASRRRRFRRKQTQQLDHAQLSIAGRRKIALET